MSETARKKLIGIADTVLENAGLLEKFNEFIEDDKIKELMMRSYDNVMKQLEEMHERAPEERKKASEDAIKSIKESVSNEDFVTRVVTSIRTDMAIMVLYKNIRTSEEIWEQVFTEIAKELGQKQAKYQLFIKDSLETEENQTIETYLETTYSGYIPQEVPEVLADMLREEESIVVPEEVLEPKKEN